MFRNMAYNTRLIVLQLIRDEKSLLFAPFSPSVTKRMKEMTWESIRTRAVAAGVMSLADRAWQYVRDSVWQAARRDAMAKKDKERKSGEGSVHFTEVDQLVFDIIGSESAVISGLEIKDSEEFSDDPDISVVGMKSQTPRIKSEANSSVYRTPIQANYRSKPRMESRSSKHESSDEELDYSIKKAKLELLQQQTEGQRLLNEQHRLSINKLKIEVEASRSSASSSSVRSSLRSLGTFNYGDDDDDHAPTM